MILHETTQCFPISLAARGETVSLIEIRGCDKVRQHLGELGLNVGLTVRVVQSDFSGPLILAVRNDTRLAIGQGMAQKIMVKYAPVEA